MKKIILFATTAIMSVMMTSCLGGGGNVVQGSAVGVLTFSDKGGLVLNSSIGLVYATEISSMMSSGTLTIDGCYYFSYSLNYDLPENAASVVQTNGYYVVTLTGVEEVPRYYLQSALTDTTHLWNDEIAVTEPLYSLAYADKHLFIAHATKHPSDVKLTWNMSYDYATMAPKEENGERIYELYIRASATNTSSLTTTTDVLQGVAYNTGQYLEEAAYREKNELGSSYNAQTSTFKLRFYYASEIKDGVITWKYKDVNSGGGILISQFLNSQ